MLPLAAILDFGSGVRSGSTRADARIHVILRDDQAIAALVGRARWPGRWDARRSVGDGRPTLCGVRELWISVALLLPVAWLGVWVGHRVHLNLAPATAARIIGAGCSSPAPH